MSVVSPPDRVSLVWIISSHLSEGNGYLFKVGHGYTKGNPQSSDTCVCAPERRQKVINLISKVSYRHFWIVFIRVKLLITSPGWGNQSLSSLHRPVHREMAIQGCFAPSNRGGIEPGVQPDKIRKLGRLSRAIFGCLRDAMAERIPASCVLKCNLNLICVRKHSRPMECDGGALNEDLVKFIEALHSLSTTAYIICLLFVHAHSCCSASSTRVAMNFFRSITSLSWLIVKNRRIYSVWGRLCVWLCLKQHMSCQAQLLLHLCPRLPCRESDLVLYEWSVHTRD